jgi:hypothetical protein
MTAPTITPADILPALPLYPDSSMLDTRGMVALSLCWLRGGRITDYLNLGLSTETLAAMLLQAASDHDRINRYRREAAAYSEGLKDGMKKAFALSNGTYVE